MRTSVGGPRRTAVPVVGFALVAACAAAAVRASAHSAPFGPTGHRVVAAIAEAHLEPWARAEVRRLLGAESLVRAATWADEVRSDPAWAHAGPWHYVTIEDGETYATSTKNQQGDAVQKLAAFTAVLRDPDASAQDKVIALRWVVHLIGDLHQPLHVGRGPDHGGNSIKVRWFGEETNLHSVWDTGLIESTHLSYTELASLLDTATDAQVRTWQAATLDDWVQESLGYRQQVYTVPQDSYGYAYRNLPLVEQRLVQAGVRLAGLLNEVFAATTAWDEMPDGLRWVRGSAEYRALARQVYASAGARLRAMAAAGELPAGGGWTVVLDADETVLDNSLYQKEQRGVFRPETWSRWCRRQEAQAVPGAREFLRAVRALGGKVAIVSNRRVETQASTEANLRSLDLPFDLVLLQDTTADKAPRWQRIEGGGTALGATRIAMFLGDSITDFPGGSQQLRDASPDAFSAFGERYFVLPNPVYGSWR